MTDQSGHFPNQFGHTPIQGSHSPNQSGHRHDQSGQMYKNLKFDLNFTAHAQKKEHNWCSTISDHFDWESDYFDRGVWLLWRGCDQIDWDSDHFGRSYD